MTKKSFHQLKSTVTESSDHGTLLPTPARCGKLLENSLPLWKLPDKRIIFYIFQIKTRHSFAMNGKWVKDFPGIFIARHSSKAKWVKFRQTSALTAEVFCPRRWSEREQNKSGSNVNRKWIFCCFHITHAFESILFYCPSTFYTPELTISLLTPFPRTLARKLFFSSMFSIRLRWRRFSES